MQHTQDFITPPPPPIVISYENGDELVHLPPYFFCSDASCGCHRDPELMAALQAMLDAGDIDAAMALIIYWNMK